MADFYLFNGKNGKGQAIDLLVNGKLQRKFFDIAELDFHTMDIPRDEAKDVLSDLNPYTDFDGMYYDIPFRQTANRITVYTPIFNCNSVKGQEYLDELKYFAELRMFNIKEHGKVGEFNYEANRDLNDLIRSVLYNICQLSKTKFDIITDKNSFISSNIKDALKARNNEYAYYDDIRYISRILKNRGIGKTLNGYTALRNLVIAYILLTEGENIKLNTQLYTAAHFDNNFDLAWDPIAALGEYDDEEEFDADSIDLTQADYRQLELANLDNNFTKLHTEVKKVEKKEDKPKVKEKNKYRQFELADFDDSFARKKTN